MLLRLKICTTVLVIYEILAVLLLHCRRTCDALFGMGFCDDHAFKYFIACFAIPAIVWLIVMWIAEIVHGNRRRHSFMYRAKTAVRDAAENVGHKIRENVSVADLEKVLAAALLIGVKKYVSKNATRRREFKRALGTDLADIELDTEFDDIDDVDYVDDNDDDDNDHQGYDDDKQTRRTYTADNRRTGTKKTGTRKK